MRSPLLLLLLLLCSAAMAQNTTTTSAVTGTAIMTPIMVPVVMPRSMNATSTAQNIMVLVPTSIDRAATTCLVGDNDVVMAVMPVTVPMIVGTQISTGAMAGAGPGTSVTMDQATLNQMISGNSAVMMAMTAPMTMDQATLDSLTAGQTVTMNQTMLNRMAGTSRKMIMVPMTTGPSATPAMAGRGPSMPIMVDKAAMSASLPDPATVMVPMMADRQTVSRMISNGSITMVVPTMTPVTTTMVCP